MTPRAPGREPFIRHGDGFEVATVWITTGHRHTAAWYVAAYDKTKTHAQYGRVTPGANTGTVDVRVAASFVGGSTIDVTYTLTGPGDAGNAMVHSMLQEADYAAMMTHWQAAVDESREKIQGHFGR